MSDRGIIGTAIDALTGGILAPSSDSSKSDSGKDSDSKSDSTSDKK